MAENDTDDKKSAAKEARLKRKSDERWLKKRIEMLERAVAKEEENRQNAIDDLKFSHGEQWDESEKDKRSKKKRPALTMNLLPPYINQLVGDQRQNRPRVKLRPVDSEASVQSAKIREGIIWNIEYLSNADAIYDQAFEMMLRSGYGAWRILTRYTEENPFLQEIYLEGIDNPLSAYLDPLCDDMVGSTADYGFILSKMSYDEFKETFPGQKLPTDTIINDLGISNAHWYDDDSVTIVEWYEKEYVDQEFCSMKDGRVIYKEQADEEISQFNKAQKLITTNAPEMLNSNIEPPEILETKTAKITKVRQWKFTASSVLEGPNDFPGKFIPIILLQGPRINIEGKSFVRSFIHYAVDAQKMINFWSSAAAERISLEPKAPWIITAQQIAGHEKEFASANTDNLPYLLYNHIEGQQPPQRQGAGTFPQALFMEIEKAESNLQKILGMFNADVGAPGSERSGAAILARQRPGDVGSFMYVDNLHRSIMHSAYVINAMIPEVYDSDRDIRIRNYDDSFAFTPINTSVGNAMSRIQKNPDIYQGADTGDLEKKYKEDDGPIQKYNDITSGKYDIVITVGPSYSTQRQEAARSIMELIQYAPQLAPLLGDLAVKSMDFLYADEAAERLEKTLPYGVKRLKPGEQPPPPPEPNPTEQAKLIQAQSLLEKAKAEKERATASIMDVKVKQLRLAKEIADTQGSMRKMVMEILAELFMPNHPADTGNALQMHTTVPLVKPPKKRKG